MARGREVTPEETSVQVLILWALGLSTVINLGTVVWNIFSGPSKKNGARLDALAGQLGLVDQRVAKVEQIQQALPSKDELHELELAMEGLKGELKAMAAVMKGQTDIMGRVEAIVARHEEHLLKKS